MVQIFSPILLAPSISINMKKGSVTLSANILLQYSQLGFTHNFGMCPKFVDFNDLENFSMKKIFMF